MILVFHCDKKRLSFTLDIDIDIIVRVSILFVFVCLGLRIFCTDGMKWIDNKGEKIFIEKTVPIVSRGCVSCFCVG